MQLFHFRNSARAFTCEFMSTESELRLYAQMHACALQVKVHATPQYGLLRFVSAMFFSLRFCVSTIS